MAEKKDFSQAITNLIDKMAKQKEDLSKNGGLGSVIGITDQEKKCAYSLGYQFFQQKKYEKALTIFQSLHMLDPINPDFAQAVAATHKESEDFESAAASYMMAYFYHPNRLDFALSSAQCMVKTGKVDQANWLLDAILQVKRFEATPENDKFVQVIRDYQSVLRNAPVPKVAS